MIVRIIKKILTKANNVFYRRKKEFEYFTRIPNNEKAGFVGYALVNLLTYIPFFPKLKKAISFSRYSLPDFLPFAPDIRDMRKYSKSLGFFIDSFYFKGVRAWEYGSFLSRVDFRTKPKILDIGPGCSPFPYYLAYKGARVTIVDIPTPTEVHFRPAGQEKVNEVTGTMLDLPFGDNSFNLVSCISSIEHLDADYPENIPVPYDLFIKRTKRALGEMIRVCKPGGAVFVTTDFYLPRQQTDRWTTEWDIGIPYKRIGGAYGASAVTGVFAKTLGLTLQPIGKINLVNSNYRGRYITTASILARKK